ncbi:MAG TPA: hypothetical protein VIR30_10350 [Nocardioides sp.]
MASDGKWYPPEQAPGPAPIPPPPPPPAPVSTADSTARNLMLAGAGAITIGSLLPWASATSIFGTVSKAGTDGDGIITLGLGVLFGIWAFMNLAPRARIAAGCVVALIALYEIVDVLGTGHDDLVVSVGIGLWIVAAGAVLAIVGSVQARR